MGQESAEKAAARIVKRVIGLYEKSFKNNRDYNELIMLFEEYTDGGEKELADQLRSLIVSATRTRKMEQKQFDSRFIS